MLLSLQLFHTLNTHNFSIGAPEKTGRHPLSTPQLVVSEVRARARARVCMSGCTFVIGEHSTNLLVYAITLTISGNGFPFCAQIQRLSIWLLVFA